MVPPPTDKLEAATRTEIDAKLELAGWAVQDKTRINLFESLGAVLPAGILPASCQDRR